MTRINKQRRKYKTMHGGFLDNISNTLTEWGSSISQGASSIWEKTKNATSNLTNSSSLTSYGNTTTQSTPMTTSTYGGRYSKRRRHRGGFKDNTPTTGIAVSAASFSGQTAKPNTIIGGKTKRHKKSGKKTRRH